jgi:hypothetical protein
MAWLLAIYGSLSLSTYLSWHFQGKNTITGDEPHYLVMASGIVKHGTLEQTLPYTEEFQSREIYGNGLAPLEATPSPGNTHAVQGPRGLFNVHNAGLPLLLALPFLLGGVVGAKLAMILFGGTALAVVWKISGVYSADPGVRLLATLATCVGLPLVPASNQIYPDILAGVIALSGLYWFMTSATERSLVLEGLWAGAIAALPWLQIKLAATSLLLIVALAIRITAGSKGIKRPLLMSSIAVVFWVGLGCYHQYAFGNLAGPYQSGALQVNKTALMVLAGLHVDQNQGFLLQNPIMFVGLFFVGALFARDRQVSFLWALVFLSLMVPNAMHSAWYGGWSLSGRFGWSAAIVFSLPTVFGLITLVTTRRRTFWAVGASSIALQGYYFFRYLDGSLDLYNRRPFTPFDDYSIYFRPISYWLPAMYNSDWAYGHPPNHSWVFLVLLVLVLGFVFPPSTEAGSARTGSRHLTA